MREEGILNKQEIIFASIIFIGALLTAYGIYLIPDEIYQVYRYFVGDIQSAGIVSAKLVDLLPLIIGLKMLSSPMMVQSLIDNQEVVVDTITLESIAISMKKLSGVVILAIGFPICYESIVELNNFTPSDLPTYELEKSLYIWHISNTASLSAMILFGIFLFSGKSFTAAISKLQTAGLKK